MVIRVLGGLLGAYTLTGDRDVLDLAAQTGRALLPALTQASAGIPLCAVQLASGTANCRAHNEHNHIQEDPMVLGGHGVIPLSELGSVQLEYAALAHATGESHFQLLADRALQSVFTTLKPKDGLYPKHLWTNSLSYASREVGFAGGSDSFYETLLKRWLQGGRKQEWLRRMYQQSLVGLRRLLRKSSPSNLTFIATADDDGQKFVQSERLNLLTRRYTHEHLLCFVPGMLALGAHTGAGVNATVEWQVARDVLHTCTQTYRRSPSGLGPEAVVFRTAEAARLVREAKPESYMQRLKRQAAEREGNPLPPSAPPDYEIKDPTYRLRPEYVESLYLMWRLDPEIERREHYRKEALFVLDAIERRCRTPSAYAKWGSTGLNEGLEDNLESFFFAETLKYLYLIFSDETEFDVDRYLLTTEAHVLPLPINLDEASAADPDITTPADSALLTWWQDADFLAE